jgi:hypothetical protein
VIITRLLAVDLDTTFFLCRPAPHPVRLVRGKRELQALAAHLALGAYRLGPCDLFLTGPERRHRKEHIRIGGTAGRGLPPVASCFPLSKLAEQLGNKHEQLPPKLSPAQCQ